MTRWPWRDGPHHSLLATPACPLPLSRHEPTPQADKHWSRVLTDRINDDVKLVGATIRCGFRLLSNGARVGQRSVMGKACHLRALCCHLLSVFSTFNILPAAAARAPTRAAC